MNDDAIKKLFGQVPYFADQVIERFEPLTDEASKFVVSSYWSDQGSVNLGDVCGTMHPDYAGLTWREFLTKGRRMAGNLAAFGENPSYYTDSTINRQPTIYFHRLDGKTFIMEEGNHRTCIGKFYLYGRDCPYIHRVHLTETVVDWHLLDLYNRLLAVCPNDWQVTVTSETVRREDGPGWKRDWFACDISVSVDDSEGEEEEEEWVFSREQLTVCLAGLEYYFMKRIEEGTATSKDAARQQARPGFFRRFFK